MLSSNIALFERMSARAGRCSLSNQFAAKIIDFMKNKFKCFCYNNMVSLLWDVIIL